MSNLPTNAADRKGIPLYRGLLKYFPDALCAVAALSAAGNQQHHPDKPLHWDKSKSTDEPDALLRHLIDAGTLDTDGQRHSAKVAWRALAMLQREIDGERNTAVAEVKSGDTEGPPAHHPASQLDPRVRELLKKENDGFPLSAEEQRELIAANA